MDTLIEILEELHPDIDFHTHTKLIDEKVIDSFDIVALVAEIDARFDVMIPAEELLPENFNSAQSLYALIQRLSDEE